MQKFLETKKFFQKIFEKLHTDSENQKIPVAAAENQKLLVAAADREKKFEIFPADTAEKDVGLHLYF